MTDAYQYARKIIKISQLMDVCFHTMNITQRSIMIGDKIRMHEFNNKMDVLFYNDHPVIDHKIAWGDDIYGYNYVTSMPVEREQYHISTIIFDPSTNEFYSNRDDIQSDDGMGYKMDFVDVDSHMFQMELLLTDRFEMYSILHALHVCGYDKTAMIHVRPIDKMNEIIDELEVYLDTHRFTR